MQKTKKSGLALGAIASLVASLFVLAPAAQASESAMVITATGAGAQSKNAMLITEPFELVTRYGTSVVDKSANLNYQYVVSTDSRVVYMEHSPDGSTWTGVAAATSLSAPVIGGYQQNITSASPYVRFGLIGQTSISSAVSITITPYINLDGVNGMGDGDAQGTPYTINFVPWSAMGAAVTVATPIANASVATASWTVTEGTLRWSQLNQNLNLKIYHSANGYAATSSATTPANVIAGSYSKSESVPTLVFTTSPAVQSVSATVEYGSASLSGLVSVGVQAASVAGLSFSPVVGVNVLGNGEARFNSAFTVRGFAYSTSNTTSIAVARSVTVSNFAGLELDADSGIVINGTTITSASALAAFGFNLAALTNTFVISTFGQADSGTDNIVLQLRNGVVTENLTINFEPAGLTAAYTPTAVAGVVGSAKSFTLSVEDQWGVAPVRSDIRIAASATLGGSTSDTVSAVITGGAATVVVTTSPAARTGSAVVTFTVQNFDQNVQQWGTLAGSTTDSVTWNVFAAAAAGSDAIVSRTASISASISYATSLSWSSETIAVRVTNTYSDVTVTAPGLMIQNVDNATQTASDTLTVAAAGNTANFKFTGRTAGTFTVTFTNGSATTTSQVVVNPARDADGATITFDTTNIAAGSTRVITGTLADANGNPVNTSGSATILVTYTVTGNAGIPIGVMPTETDVDGKFTITVLTGANDSGTAVVSATYYKAGASTAVADVLTFNQSIVVGGAAAAPASDQKLTVGSFKGFVAIYALNYTGQKLSAKVAGKWLVVNELSKFQRVVRNTGAGFTIKVDLYIDGAFVRSETVVTK